MRKYRKVFRSVDAACGWISRYRYHKIRVQRDKKTGLFMLCALVDQDQYEAICREEEREEGKRSAEIL